MANSHDAAEQGRLFFDRLGLTGDVYRNLVADSRDRERCFYCSIPLCKGRGEQDHMPVPANCGGLVTVWTCQPCHDAKDRVSADDLPRDAMQQLLAEWDSLGRWTRILLARTLRAGFEMDKTRRELALAEADRRLDSLLTEARLRCIEEAIGPLLPPIDFDEVFLAAESGRPLPAPASFISDN